MIRNTPTTRVVCSTITLTVILLVFAEHFDLTEVKTLMAWCATWAMVEIGWAVRDRRSGRMRFEYALACLVVASVLLPRYQTCGTVTRLQGETQPDYAHRVERAAVLGVSR